ncbi:bifunctional aspartokinase/homoserine dehydrogenase 1 isoform X2 [Tanacetum coccineum]
MGPNAMSLEDFLKNGLPMLDDDIEERIKKASSNENVLRYVCIIDTQEYISIHFISVALLERPKDSALGRLKGSDNVVEIYTEQCYSDRQPLVIQGPGAGNNTTAAGVLADILDLQDLYS